MQFFSLLFSEPGVCGILSLKIYYWLDILTHMRGALSGVLVRPVVALRDAVAAVVDGHAVARAAPELEGRARCNQIGHVR